jgi:hypothetical protein
MSVASLIALDVGPLMSDVGHKAERRELLCMHCRCLTFTGCCRCGNEVGDRVTHRTSVTISCSQTAIASGMSGVGYIVRLWKSSRKMCLSSLPLSF